jgi:hypothetical protein
MSTEKLNTDDVEVGQVALDMSVADTTTFDQHDDPDVIIPDLIARPLVYSAHLLLINAIVALVFYNYGLFAVLLFVYFTSIWHWSAPRFSALARRVDYFAVFVAIFYGSFYVSYNMKQQESEQAYLDYLLVWFVGLAVICVVFVCNESSYYIQVMKLPSGSSTGEDSTIGCVDTSVLLPATKAHTPERDWVYKRTVYVHLLCIHVFANALAFVLIISTQISV